MSKLELGLVITLLAGICLRLIPNPPWAELDYDEGLNLVKALLVSQGHSLYSEIWSDQPPLYTHLLVHWMDRFGWTLTAARSLTWIFTLLLLTSLYLMIRSRNSLPAAALSVLLLLGTQDFVDGSGAVMIGLPSLSLCLFSMSLLMLGRDVSHRSRLALFWASGFVFACALLTKIIVIVYLPALLFLLWEQYPKARRNVLVWLIMLLGFTVILGLLLENSLGAHFWAQIVQPHRIASTLGRAGPPLYVLSFDQSIHALALISLLRFRQRLIVPALCLAGGLGVMLAHHPPRWHHYFLISVPACWLVGCGLVFIYDELKRALEQREFARPSSMLNVLSMLVFAYILFGLPERVRRLRENYHNQKIRIEAAVLENLQEESSASVGLVTDRPIYAFLSQRSTPPDLAVLSAKRFRTGLLTEGDFFDGVAELRAEKVVISRFGDLKERASTALKESYELKLDSGETKVYERR